ncbi:MAG: hypothetical protein HY077_18115 [Elusimicrobia bacterium]|nr:hypothetical protein [Elusimicrobiota bacterium]
MSPSCGLLAALAAVAWAQPNKSPEDCPAGYERVPTTTGVEPFHCKPRGIQPPFIELKPNYKMKLRCPKGFEAVATPGETSRYRCAPAKPPDSADPMLAPVLGAPKTPGAKTQAAAPPSSFVAPSDYLRYTVKGHMQFEYPRDWHLVNGWSDEVPTIYIEFDTGRQGRQVTMVLSRITRAQADFEDVESAIAREKEYQNSAETAKGRVGSFPARFTALADASRTAYVLVGDDDYFTLSYGAPDDLFKTFEPVYKRLLRSFKVAKRAPGAQ